MQTPSPLQMSDLLRVIPIAQTQQRGEVLITLLALEVYANGCVMTSLLRIAPGTVGIHERFGYPSFKLVLQDDRGTSYASTPQGASGYNASDFWQGRAECSFLPTLDPLARELAIEIPELVWQRAAWSEEGLTGHIPGETTPGPWIFRVAIEPESA